MQRSADPFLRGRLLSTFLLLALSLELSTSFAFGADLNMNLQSTQRMPQPAAATSQPVAVRMGNRVQVFQPNSALTPAQATAVNQVVTSGNQTLLLDPRGVAVGGSMVLPTTQNLSSLVVPHNVTVITEFESSASLNILGQLLNSGTLHAVSLNSSISTAAIKASSVVNASGGLITTFLPSRELYGLLDHAIPNLSLNISAPKSVINKGTISSARDLKIDSPNIQNHGVLSAARKLTLAAAADNANLSVNNSGGTISAPHIIFDNNLATKQGKLSILGGNLLSEDVTVFGGAGNAALSVRELPGLLSVRAGSGSLGAQSSLRLGEVKMSGDPTFFSMNDLRLTTPIKVNEAITLLAQGNVDLNGQNVQSSVDGGKGHDITIVAGTRLTALAGGLVRATGASGIGGDIVCGGCTINSSSADESSKGGKVTLAAFTAADGTRGNIDLSVGAINTSSQGGVAGSLSVIGKSINLNNVSAIGPIGKPAITLVNAKPIVSISATANGAIRGTVAPSGVLHKDGVISLNGEVRSPGASFFANAGQRLVQNPRADVILDGRNSAERSAGAIKLRSNSDVELHAQWSVVGASGFSDEKGGAGGSISITAARDLTFFGAAALDTTGGNGGLGTFGDFISTNGIHGAPGRAGGDGGSGGAVTIRAENLHGADGSIFARGGSGGGGGNGANGWAENGLVGRGGNGGAGGNGGSSGRVYIATQGDAEIGPIFAGAGSGAFGGVGGGGADGDVDAGIAGGAGGSGGRGGSGGLTRGVLVLSQGKLELSNSLSLEGANGGDGGAGGTGGVGGNRGIGGSTGGVGGGGRPGGAFTAFGKSIVGAISLSNSGGSGGLGGDGGNGQTGSSYGGIGGSSGSGGNGAAAGRALIVATASDISTSILGTSVNAEGGRGGNAGLAGSGGNGGIVGGAGGLAEKGGNAGRGGLISLRAPGQFNSAVYILNNGGIGGSGSPGSAGGNGVIGGRGSNAGAGGAGGIGGNFVLTAGALNISGPITSSGGLGGNGSAGGLGGNGESTGGSGGSGSAGGVGGSAGYISILGREISYGEFSPTAIGGNGGNGGAAGNAGDGSKSGGSGGGGGAGAAGGLGGTLRLRAVTGGITPVGPSSYLVAASLGGYGGVGTDGGAGGAGAMAGRAGNGGSGGAGRDGGSLSIIAQRDLMIVGGLSTNGGYGGNAGSGGEAKEGDFGGAGGNGGTGGGAGNGGSIVLRGAAVSGPAWIGSPGGYGGGGGNGSASGESQVGSSRAGGHGATGGAGGTAGSLSVYASSGNLTLHSAMDITGGVGGTGGSGGYAGAGQTGGGTGGAGGDGGSGGGVRSVSLYAPRGFVDFGGPNEINILSGFAGDGGAGADGGGTQRGIAGSGGRGGSGGSVGAIGPLSITAKSITQQAPWTVTSQLAGSGGNGGNGGESSDGFGGAGARGGRGGSAAPVSTVSINIVDDARLDFGLSVIGGTGGRSGPGGSGGSGLYAGGNGSGSGPAGNGGAVGAITVSAGGYVSLDGITIQGGSGGNADSSGGSGGSASRLTGSGGRGGDGGTAGGGGAAGAISINSRSGDIVAASLSNGFTIRTTGGAGGSITGGGGIGGDGGLRGQGGAGGNSSTGSAGGPSGNIVLAAPRGIIQSADTASITTVGGAGSSSFVEVSGGNAGANAPAGGTGSAGGNAGVAGSAGDAGDILISSRAVLNLGRIATTGGAGGSGEFIGGNGGSVEIGTGGAGGFGGIGGKQGSGGDIRIVATAGDIIAKDIVTEVVDGGSILGLVSTPRGGNGGSALIAGTGGRGGDAGVTGESGASGSVSLSAARNIDVHNIFSYSAPSMSASFGGNGGDTAQGTGGAAGTGTVFTPGAPSGSVDVYAVGDISIGSILVIGGYASQISGGGGGKGGDGTNGGAGGDLPGGEPGGDSGHLSIRGFNVKIDFAQVSAGIGSWLLTAAGAGGNSIAGVGAGGRGGDVLGISGTPGKTGNISIVANSLTSSILAALGAPGGGAGAYGTGGAGGNSVAGRGGRGGNASNVPAGAGGRGGDIGILLLGKDTVNNLGELLVTGGDFGQGAEGGPGGSGVYGGHGGFGGAAGPGGSAGNILVRSAAVPNVSILTKRISATGVAAGLGSNGGTGGDSMIGRGGAGGNAGASSAGGAGGTIVILGRKDGFVTSLTQPENWGGEVLVGAEGGAGGSGVLPGIDGRDTLPGTKGANGPRPILRAIGDTAGTEVEEYCVDTDIDFIDEPT